jgi:tRNA(fMet)-specific endonuclease VapC
MSYLLDTNVCIRYLNGKSENTRKQLESKLPEDIVVCSVVKAELFYGALKSVKPEQNFEKICQFSDGFVSLPFDDKASEEYGKIRSMLKKNSEVRGWYQKSFQVSVN